jgi:hypothetical protein
MPATWFGGSDQGDAYKGASFGHDGFDSHPRYGGSDCGSEDELEQRMRNCGFTDADADELLCQGVKPWDDDAWDGEAGQGASLCGKLPFLACSPLDGNPCQSLQSWMP